MKALKVRVQDGHISGEAPPGLPEGELELCLAEPDEEMTEEEAAEVNRLIEAGWHAIQQGRFRPASDVLADLRSRG